MLTIRCAGCKRKLWKYDKIGHGEVLRCHKARITKVYDIELIDSEGEKLVCHCGKEIGIDKGSNYKMVKKAFTYSGEKRSK